MHCPKRPAQPNDRTLSSQLRKLAEEKPDKPAFVFIDAKWDRFVLTRKEVWDLSRQYANVMIRNGLKKGDVLCNSLTNSPEKLLTTYGTVIAGGISLHRKVFQADGSDLLHCLKTSNCTTIILDPGDKEGPYFFLKTIEYLDEETGRPRYKGLPCLVNAIYISVVDNDHNDAITEEHVQCQQNWLRVLPRAEPFYENESVSVDDIVFLYNTSGTTGSPKMVAHTHTNVFTINFADLQKITNENSVFFNDRCLGWLGGAPITYPDIGYTRVLADFRFEMTGDDTTRIYQTLVNEKCDSGLLTPMILNAVIQMAETKPASSLRLRRIVTGGAAVIIRDLSKLWRITDFLDVLYGATETSYNSSALVRQGDNWKNLCIGRPFPGMEIRIVDDQLQDVSYDVVGDVLIKSNGACKGYFKQPEKDKGVFLPDGWVKIGDVAFFNDEGQIVFVNRKCDGIMTSSGIFYPGVLEAELTVLPGIQGASVMSIPLKTSDTAKTPQGEICVCIHLLPESNVTEEALRQFCRDFRQSTKMNIPEPDYFLFFEKFPYLPNGKFSRVVLKEQALARLKGTI